MLVKKKPELWGSLYRDSDDPGWKYSTQCWLDNKFCRKLERLLNEEEADWAVCTHSLPQPRIDLWRQKNPGLKVAAIVTDLYPHSMWLRGNPDRWFVASEWSKQVLMERVPGSEDRIVVTGIPIHPVFASDETKESARTRMGVAQDRPSMLMTIGGIGGGPIKPFLELLAAQTGRRELHVVCGRNKKLQAELELMSERLSSEENLTIRIWGHLDLAQMSGLMKACDLLIGKPGGLTTSEAMAVGIPFLVVDMLMIPGQEEGNAEFLVEEGIGVRASTLSEAAQIAGELIEDKDRLADMSSNALRCAQPDSVRKIVDSLISD
jgi:processive 1,2-diacylglycerol beta-glucosyltransferase